MLFFSMWFSFPNACLHHLSTSYIDVLVILCSSTLWWVDLVCWFWYLLCSSWSASSIICICRHSWIFSVLILVIWSCRFHSDSCSRSASNLFDLNPFIWARLHTSYLPHVCSLILTSAVSGIRPDQECSLCERFKEATTHFLCRMQWNKKTMAKHYHKQKN